MVMAPAVARAASPVPAVQQPVEQRAQQHQQIRQGAEDVGGVLGEKEEGGNGEKADKYRAHGRAEKATRAKRVFTCHDGSSPFMTPMPLGTG
jgi:hypothetical protein